MNYQSTTPRSNRAKGFMVKHVLQFALFAGFSLWLLYQIKQPAGEGGAGSQLSNTHISNFLGRKGSAGISKSTFNPHPGLTLEDVTNPVEEGEIRQYSKEIEAVEFYTTTGSLKEGNDNNTLLSSEEESSTIAKLNISFPDENGIPQHVRDKFIEIDSSNLINRDHGKRKRQSRSVIVTRVGNGRDGSVEES